MKNSKTLIQSACLILLTALTACSHQMTTQVVSHQSISDQGEHGILLDQDRWLLLGPESDLQLFDGQNTLKHWSVSGEYLDVRHVSNNELMAATVTPEHKLLLLNLNVQTQSLTQRISEVLPVPLEGMCLYQPKYEGLQVFLLAEDHMAYQMLVREAKNNIELELIRKIPLPPGAEYCTVDDARHHLYINEEDIGVWQYNARSESMIKRHLVELVAPKGKLKSNSGPIAIVKETLILSEKGSSHIHTYGLNDSQPEYIGSGQLPGNIINDGMHASQIDDQHAVLMVLDEATGKLVSVRVELVSKTQAKQLATEVVQIPVDVETKPVDKKGDAADDPAVWVHPTQPEKSKILGTNKKQGLFVYDLKGKQLQSLLVDRVNNVDVRKGFTYAGKPMDIATASQRDRRAIALFKIDPANGRVSAAEEIVTTLDDVYGLCMAKNKQNQIHVYINDEDGRYEQWQILDTKQGWTGKKVREFAVASQPEGCTVDERNNRLFVGEEAKGVWALGASAEDSTQMKLIAEVGKDSGLVADVEGMEIYQNENKNWLVVSSQGDDSYVIFEADAPFKSLGKFRLGLNADTGIDGVSETDGLTVVADFLGDDYPNGVMVAQDGRNHMPEENQNFKLVDWRKIQKGLNLPD